MLISSMLVHQSRNPIQTPADPCILDLFLFHSPQEEWVRDTPPCKGSRGLLFVAYKVELLTQF